MPTTPAKGRLEIHGTHVAGIIGGDGATSTGIGFTRTFKGVAPNTNLVNLRVLSQNGSAAESDVISAIQRAIQLQSTYNIRVINLSLGHPIYESYTLDPLCQAVEAAWKSGIFVVVAAGNYGRDNSIGTRGYGRMVKISKRIESMSVMMDTRHEEYPMGAAIGIRYGNGEPKTATSE